MASWQEFVDSVPEFGERVEALFAARKHHTMATLRSDGSPRISGPEVDFDDGELCLGMMAGTLRAEDLRRDSRVAIHSQGVDPPEGNPSAWCGEAKLSGDAVQLAAAAEQSSDRFRIDIADVVLTRIGTPANHLVIERWTPNGGLVRSERR
ncbi:MAG: pyridoxamine 5'-phosphate oxidase family protein [Solirubrobacteraceae bacterium]